VPLFLRKLWAASTVLGLILSSTGCWEGTTRGVLATVLAVDGSATTVANPRAKAALLAPGTHLAQRQIVETSGASRVAIALLSNLLVQLDHDARMEILRLAITKDGNETGPAMQGRYAEVKLMSGRMFVSQAWGEAIARFTITTPHGDVITASNALFCVESNGQNTRVTCVSGSVALRARDAQAATRIEPGFIWEWSASSSSMIAAEGDARGQEELQEGLEIEQQLRDLIAQNRDALPR
jgi:ferric-dicitrate binding protein FerR (iron transport regulator)